MLNFENTHVHACMYECARVRVRARARVRLRVPTSTAS